MGTNHLRAAAALALVLTAGCTTLPGVEPRVEEVRAHVSALDADGVDLTIELDVLNPYLSSLHEPFLRYSLEVADRTLASERRAAGAAFPATGVGTVAIDVRVGYADLAAAHGSLDGVAEVPYRLRGEFRAPLFGGNLDLPFEHAGAVPVVRPPILRVVRVDVAELGPAGGGLAVAAEVTNPNTFPLTLEDVAITLLDGERPVAALRPAVPAPVAAGETRPMRLHGTVTGPQSLERLGRVGNGAAPVLRVSGSLATPWGPLRLAR